MFFLILFQVRLIDWQSSMISHFPKFQCVTLLMQFSCFLSTESAFWPVFLIANVAALIASRAMTTATFSCIKQSTALGCFPRLKIIHTSRKFMGQIYIPVLNWFLLAVCLVVVCSISSMYEIGNAYGNVFTFSLSASSIALPYLNCMQYF